MKIETHWVYLYDEVPSIGCGWRSVEVRIGYKWVHIKRPGAARGTAIARKVWDKITERKYETPERNRKGLALLEIPNAHHSE